MSYYGRWAPYVPVAQRRARAAREAKSLAGKGQKLRPINIPGRNITNSFWGKAWCQNLEKYSDWANRMPRGRTYARNGSIVDLQITEGKIASLVYGSEMYKIQIKVEKIKQNTWKAIRKDCASKVGSLIDLMRGKLPAAVLERLTSPKNGIFPSPDEIEIKCSCPDWAVMCKHAAATLYGVGHLLDSEPELFFLMRGVSQKDLIADALQTQDQSDSMGLDAKSTLDSDDLGALFGIDLASTEGSTDKEESKSKRKTPTRSRTKTSPQTEKTGLSRRYVQATKSKAATKKAATKKAVRKTNPKITVAATTAKEKRSAEKPSVSNPKGTKKVATKKVATNKAVAKKVLQKKAARKKAVRKTV